MLERGYGSLEVLRGLDMTVAAGSIYGLLGPSGCGKTTLLKVLLGRLVPWSGSALALGGAPGEPGAPVPGPAVGYAPQELALYDDLSIGETLRFHGRLQLLEPAQVAQREAWLLDFLDLPDPERVVGKLSGGQKRRVSLAVALLLIGKGVECLPIFLFTAGKWTDAFRQHSQFRHIDGNLASLGGKDVSLCSHNVAYIEELEHLVVFLANVIPFDVALNFSHIILDVEKRRFPHPAERDQASGR